MERNNEPGSKNSLEISGNHSDSFNSNQPGSTKPLIKKWINRLAWTAGFGVTTLASALAGVFIALTVPLPEQASLQEDESQQTLSELFRKGVRHTVAREVNILVMGIDRVPNAEAGSSSFFAGRSDTMLLIQVDPESNSVSMLSIPRDTQVTFPGLPGVTKINHANAMGGPRLASDVVSYNLGNIYIDRYVRFSTDAFRELVDLLGGVDVFVPQRMYYVDRTQDLYIDLEEGRQVLNGDQAEQFARFRGDANGDIGRVQRQQVLIRALRDRLMSPAVLPRIPQILQLLQTHIDTNLSPEELLALATFGLELEGDSLRMVMLPGTFSQPNEYRASYWLMDNAGVSRVLDDYFGISSIRYTNDRFLSDNFRAERKRERRLKRTLSNLRIAVQNASDEPQVARQVVRYLQEQGFENVYAIHDWPIEQNQTQIIAQNGYLQGASMLEKILGVGRVVPSSTGELGSDFTIRVGSDWLQQPDLEL